MTTFQPSPMADLLDRVALTDEADRAYVTGALVERALRAAERGEKYTWQTFVRDALIEAAHR
jgi:hypothetical protein